MHRAMNNIPVQEESVNGSHRVSRRHSREISDHDAKMISEPYRLMTMTHSRLSSVSPPTNRHSSPRSQATKRQPILGLTQRRRKYDENRRRTVHGIEYTQEIPMSSHARRHSDTLLQCVEYTTPDSPNLPELRLSDYNLAIDGNKLNMSLVTSDISDSVRPSYNLLQRSVSFPSRPHVIRQSQQSHDTEVRPQSWHTYDKYGRVTGRGNIAPVTHCSPEEFNYEFSESCSSQEDTRHYYDNRHQIQEQMDEYRRESEVYGKIGSYGYNITLTPAEQAIGKSSPIHIWLWDERKMQIINNQINQQVI